MSFDYFKPYPKPPKSGKKPKKPLPKRSKRWKPASRKERSHLTLIKSLPCCACGKAAPSQAHHICEGGKRLGHMFTLPLCFLCHEGNFCSIGNTKKSFIEKYGTEIELLEKTRLKLNRLGLLTE